VRSAARRGLTGLATFLGPEGAAKITTELVTLAEEDEALLLAVASAAGEAENGVVSLVAPSVLASFCSACNKDNKDQNCSRAFKNLRLVIPFLALETAKCMPKVNAPELEEESDLGEHDLMSVVLLDADAAAMSRMRAILSREWYETWPALTWSQENMCDRVAEALSKMTTRMEESADLLKAIINCFGRGFAANCLRPKVEKYSRASLTAQASSLKAADVLILGKLLEPQKINEVMKDWLTLVALQGPTVEVAIWTLGKLVDDNAVDLKAIIGPLVTHDNHRVRMAAASTLVHDVQVVAEEILELSSDPDAGVRASVAPSLATAAVEHQQALKRVSAMLAEDNVDEIKIKSDF